jgi:CPA2 family monovalent cation:H+ antiporter-2
MTSTVLLVRLLDERRLRHRPESQLAMGVSLVQDIALGPILVALSLLIPLGERHSTWQIAGGLALCLAATAALRRFLASALFQRVRAAQMPELEVAFSVMLALGAAVLTERCGLGAALGAFCAGLAFGGDENRNLVDAGTRPLQGLTAIVFFMAMGALFDPAFALHHAGTVAALVGVGLLVKAPVCWLVLRLGGLRGRSAVGYGLALAPVGEFSFVLATAAFANAHDQRLHYLYQLVVAATCINLAATPLLFLLAERFLPRSGLDAVRARGRTIVVAGLGPVGNSVVETLRRQGHALFLVDRNERLLSTWRDAAGVRIHLGRIEDMEAWLPELGHRPALVVLTFPIADASAEVARRLRALEPGLPIIARAPFQAQVDLLRAAGAQWVICDERATAEALLPMLAEALAASRSDVA